MIKGSTVSSQEPFQFENLPVMGILRGVDAASLEGVLKAAQEAGLIHIEITLNTPEALSLIKMAVSTLGSSLCVGAGTVLSEEDARRAHAAGARFLVSPTLSEPVAAYCRQAGLPYFPGAFTPTEIQNAWESGACMVKLFPASRMGPDYVREIKGPLDGVQLMAVGGIKMDNLEDYFRSGASAVAVGGSIFSVERMRKREFSMIQKDLQEIVLAVKKISNTIK